MPTPDRLVFADVDETLIHCKSSFDFLRYYHAGRDGAEGARRADQWTVELLAHSTAGLPREEGNRRYFRLWRGAPARETEVWARRWLAERSADPGFFVESTLRELRAHQEAGAGVVLVSGSFPPLLAQLADLVGAVDVLCARMERCGRVWTGGLTGPPVIGEEKRRRVREVLARHPGVDPADCFAYGDHSSDLPMLREVGHPVVVGGPLRTAEGDPFSSRCLPAA